MQVATYNAAGDLIERNLAAGRGAQTAIIDDHGHYSYAELADPSEGSERIWAAILRKPFSLRELQLTLAPLPSAAAEASNRAPA